VPRASERFAHISVALTSNFTRDLSLIDTLNSDYTLLNKSHTRARAHARMRARAHTHTHAHTHTSYFCHSFQTTDATVIRSQPTQGETWSDMIYIYRNPVF
jgi:hypothetical protein